MKVAGIKDIRNLSLKEIKQQILITKKEIFFLRLQKATKQLEKTHLFKHNRKKLAQLLTVQTELI
uniref:Large ribosomal subunit protein uL29c n=1 Tax=Rhodochaete parvula TaxID=110510 RepID=A0A1X9PWH3_9RHOD|nr:50S ribosomal protein L29 [Rhodochaete parvula]ASK39620.1 ribosomal protein L29 [Rhodochaete parvula]